jgi:hypothetical protein
MDKSELAPADFGQFYETFAKPQMTQLVFGFVAAWWPYRHSANVLLLHFSDMKRDHEGSVRRIADFLGFEPTASQWASILECTSFAWMKKNEDRFELRAVSRVPILKPGAMVRKGKAGSARDDGVTPAMSAEIAAIGREELADDAAFDWCYNGGALP